MKEAQKSDLDGRNNNADEKRHHPQIVQSYLISRARDAGLLWKNQDEVLF